MKEHELTTADLKTLFVMCESWIRKNKTIDSRKESVEQLDNLKQKLFDQFKHTI